MISAPPLESINQLLRRNRLVVRAAVVLVFLNVLVFTAPPPAEAVAYYYVNNKAGSNCSDAGPGTSESAPWCTFTPVNAHTFLPGEALLLQRGATWNQMMVIKGGGTAALYVYILPYGSASDPRPKIDRNGGHDKAIWLWDPSYIVVAGLELADAEAGLVAYSTDGGGDDKGLIVDNMYTHNIRGNFATGAPCQTIATGTYDIAYSAGITVLGCFTRPTQTYVAQDVVISNIESFHDQTAIRITGLGNTLITNVYLHDGDGAAPSGGPGTGCYTGLDVSGSVSVTVVNAWVDKVAACTASTGQTGVQFVNDQSVSVVNSMVINTPSDGESGFDYEKFNKRVSVRNNLIGGNYGTGVEFLAISGPSPTDTSSDSEVSGNTFIHNGVATGRGAIYRYGDHIVPTGTIKDNLFSEAWGPISVGGNGDFTGFTFSGNKILDTTATVWYSAASYSTSTQGANNFKYQYRTSSTGAWTDLTAGSDGTWYTASVAGAKVSRFWQHPGSAAACTTSSPCDVARTWTAPSAGQISIRGRVLKSTVPCASDGVYAKITKNGSSTAWGPTLVTNEANPIIGTTTNLDDYTVAAGDVLRFEVNMNANATCDEASWVPSLAYTSYRTDDWGFNLNGYFEGWTPYASTLSSWSVSGGNLNVTGTASFAPHVLTPLHLGVDGSANHYVRLRINNPGAAATGIVYFTTAADQVFDTIKYKTFAVATGWNTIQLDMSTVAAWTASPIRQLLIGPVATIIGGTASIDYVRITKT